MPAPVPPPDLRLDGELAIDGLTAPVSIRRDPEGVPHIEAASEADAWLGMGFAAAQDRLWQMEYDRLRATGRWASVVGPTALAADQLARRLQLRRAAEADVAAMAPATRAMFESYSAGVNAFLQTQPLPPEYAMTGLRPDPWEPWHSTVAFKVRHVLMGPWQLKLAYAVLLARVGPQRYAQAVLGPPRQANAVLPPGGAIRDLFEQSGEEIAAAAEPLGFLAETMAGSNSWLVNGARTTTGMPVLCNDSHRQLDVPNVYWQVHLRCPSFDVTGATFPGLPGLPHFGHNGAVAWCITHAMADDQDLYIEEFDSEGRYRTAAGWTAAEHSSEMIDVAGVDPVPVDIWRTRHGPIVHGDPTAGLALALRYTATEAASRGFEVLRPMLSAPDVPALFDTQRAWVDPVNNMLAADTTGNGGYLTRGRIPVRASTAGRRLPVAGWTDEHEWIGDVSEEQRPRSINPPEGFIATANQSIVEGDSPYISSDFFPPARAERIVERLRAAASHEPGTLVAMQGDTTSTLARRWGQALQSMGPFQGHSETARGLLAGWDGNLLPESNAAVLYAHFRGALLRRGLGPIIGDAALDWLASEAIPASVRILGAWLDTLARAVAGEAEPPSGVEIASLTEAALADAWVAAVSDQSADSDAWRWDRDHATLGVHTLAGAFPSAAAALNPPRAHFGGDGDTVQQGGYGYRDAFDVSYLSVYRQAVDLSAIDDARWIVPGGVSGVPGSPHFSDQLERWRRHELAPMRYTESDIARDARHDLRLLPPG